MHVATQSYIVCTIHVHIWVFICQYMYVGSCGRVVKAMDLKSIGIFPHRFKSCQLRYFYFLSLHVLTTYVLITAAHIAFLLAWLVPHPYGICTSTCTYLDGLVRK